MRPLSEWEKSQNKDPENLIEMVTDVDKLLQVQMLKKIYQLSGHSGF